MSALLLLYFAFGGTLPLPAAPDIAGPSACADRDWVIVGREDMLAACAPLIARRAVEGFRVTLVTSRAERRSSGSADRLRRTLHRLVRAGRRPGFLLLVGDPAGESATLRTSTRPGLGALGADYAGFDAVIPSDAPFVDVDEDGRPEGAVGRLPARTPEEAALMVTKILRQEILWARARPRRTGLGIIINEGGRGAWTDRLVGSALDGVLRDALPRGLEARVLHGLEGRAGAVPPERFRDAVIRELSRPSVATIYAGHGWTTALAPRQGHPTFTMDDVSRLRGPGPAAPLVALACNIAGLGRASSMGKALLRHERGPCALIAAGDPATTYGGIVLGHELLSRLRTGDGAPRLGELLREAKLALLDRDAASPARRRLRAAARSFGLDTSPAALRHTADVYLLFGDPAQRLAPPAR